MLTGYLQAQHIDLSIFYGCAEQFELAVLVKGFTRMFSATMIRNRLRIVD